MIKIFLGVASTQHPFTPPQNACSNREGEATGHNRILSSRVAQSGMSCPFDVLMGLTPGNPM